MRSESLCVLCTNISLQRIYVADFLSHSCNLLMRESHLLCVEKLSLQPAVHIAGLYYINQYVTMRQSSLIHKHNLRVGILQAF